MPMINYSKKIIMNPKPGCLWADKMILNPAIIQDSEDASMLHMLFRATGAFSEKQLAGKPLPYPICLGYAVSRNSGKSWDADFSKPALAPTLNYDSENMFTINICGKKIINYANGCIEDPRLFYFEDKLYLSAACRAFPAGPYWEHDDPQQCMPDWAVSSNHNMGKAITENSTVTLLFEVNLPALANGNYENAFKVIGPLHNPDISDDRDAFLFPRRLKINGQDKIICIHRPKHPWKYPEGKGLSSPSIFLAAADSIFDFSEGKAKHHILATPMFEWEKNRIGGSWPPIEVRRGEWLFPYHGKQDDKVGYTQSFMILEETTDGFPSIKHRPSGRLMYADKPWEFEGDFTIPCMFTCSGVILKDNTLLMGYGAADQKIGIAQIPFHDLLDTLYHC